MRRYHLKEIYCTLQGEGANAGRVAVFCRFSGCNLWSGLESGRSQGRGGCAAWCDTDFVGTDGPGGGSFDSPEAVARAARAVWDEATAHAPDGRPLAVCTGGEPLLQLDSPLVAALHAVGFEIAIETNGTVPVPEGIDWVCVSPKAGTELVVTQGQELKLVHPQAGVDPARFEGLAFEHRFLQPLDGPDAAEHTRRCIAYCLAHPGWRLSLQTHKLVGIP